METMLVTVLIVAAVLAVSLALFAWRVLRRNHQQREERVALLRQLAFDPEPTIAIEPTPMLDPIDLLREAPQQVFAATYAAPAPRRWTPVVLVLLFIVIGAGTVYGLYRPDMITAIKVPTQVLPLDLFSLSHRFEAGDLVVTGLIQNPRTSRAVPSVVAVVYVFNEQGDYVASGRTPLEFAPLVPGADAPFIVRVPGVSGVSRFRVGFRAADGSVVAHVDRRGDPLEGTTAGIVSTSGGQ
jgi:hypothetical protein